MAEVRKYDPAATSPIGDQVRSLLGAVPRPVTPGEPETVTDSESKTAPEQAGSTAASSPAASFAVTDLPGGSWFAVGSQEPAD